MDSTTVAHQPVDTDVLAALAREDVEVARPVVDFIDAVNRGDIDAAIDLLHPEALHHGQAQNYRPEGVRLLFNTLRTVFPDLELQVRDVRVEGQRVVTRVVATGTHTGAFLGKPATGQPVAWETTDVSEIFDEKIFKRFWDLWNDPDLQKQIGFIPAINC